MVAMGFDVDGIDGGGGGTGAQVVGAEMLNDGRSISWARNDDGE